MLRKFFNPALGALARLARSLDATMLFQSDLGVEVKYKVEPSFNVAAASGAGAKRFRLNGGGLSMAMAEIRSNERRADFRSSMPRYGSKNVAGGYSADLSVGSFDDLIEAVLRGTSQAALSITFATMTTVTTVADGIIAAAGDWRTQGLRVGQIFRATGLPDAANNSRNLRIVGLTALKITTAETLIVNAAADATGTIDVGKRIIQGDPIVKRSFTFEEYNSDVDESELFTGGKLASMGVSGGPDAMAIAEFGIVGADEQALLAAASPYFTAPTVPTGIGLTLADAVIRFGGADILTLSSAAFALDNQQGGQAVIGGRVTPEIFEGPAQLTGSITAIREDLGYVRKYLAETDLELLMLLTEPGAEPKPYLSFFLGRIKLGKPDKSLGGGNALMETVPFIGGNKDATTGYDDTMIQSQTSAT